MRIPRLKQSTPKAIPSSNRQDGELAQLAQQSSITRSLSELQLQADNSKVVRDIRDMAPIQRSVTKKGVRYSFLDMFDLDGNPYLASEEKGEKKQWKLNKSQPQLRLEQKDDLYSPIETEDHPRVMHNLSFGRPQPINMDGEKAVIAPFKSYQFGVDTRPEVAVYPVGDDQLPERAPYYPDLEKMAKKDIGESSRSSKRKRRKSVKRLSSRMGPLLLAEDYRTPGATELFNKRKLEYIETGDIESSDEEPPQKRRKRTSSKKMKSKKVSVDRIAKKLTTDMGFAGTKGKHKFRKQTELRKNRTLVEVNRSIGRRSPSPERTSTSRGWDRPSSDSSDDTSS